MDTTILRCPGCGANIQFDAQTQTWLCAQCGTQYTAQDIFKLTTDSDLDTKINEPQPTLNVYKCQSCGAEMVADENTTATFCVYCHNPGIIKSRLEGEFRPDYIIPFQKSKKDAVNAYNAYRKGKYITFKEFGDPKNIEKITGVYVPFWLYNGRSQAYVAGKLHTSSSKREGDYIVTTKCVYNIERAGYMIFRNVPADGSVKFDDNTMDSIEPYDFTQLIPFNYSYLSGYLAEKYDVSAAEDQSRAKYRMENTLINKINGTINGTLTDETKNLDTYIDRPKYALLPVWMLNTIIDGKPYTYAMNGQTGRIVGNIPISKANALAFFLIIALIAMSIVSAISYWLFM